MSLMVIEVLTKSPSIGHFFWWPSVVKRNPRITGRERKRESGGEEEVHQRRVPLDVCQREELELITRRTRDRMTP